MFEIVTMLPKIKLHKHSYFVYLLKVYIVLIVGTYFFISIGWKTITQLQLGSIPRACFSRIIWHSTRMTEVTYDNTKMALLSKNIIKYHKYSDTVLFSSNNTRFLARFLERFSHEILFIDMNTFIEEVNWKRTETNTKSWKKRVWKPFHFIQQKENP